MAEGMKARAGLATKLALGLSFGVAAMTALLGYLALELERRHFEGLVLANAERMCDLIRRSARYSMLRNDRDALYHLIRDIGEEEGVHRVRIFNEQGRISFSTLASEVGAMVDKQTEACYGCHAQESPLTALARPDRQRTFQEASGERILGVIRPIDNHTDCFTAACHAHPKERRILGVIDQQFSLARVDAQLAELRQQVLWGAAASGVLFFLVSGLTVWVFIHRPVRELMTGIAKLSAGDLSYRIPVRSRDELARLGESFNKMAADLQQAYDELTRDARTLEERVRAKTTELERTYASLMRSEKMASLGKLSATVAHEVNNPLFGMLTYARLALKALERSRLEDPAKTELAEHLRVIERESKRCGDIMRNLLLFARQEAMNGAERREPTDLDTILRRALKLVRHQLELQQIELECHLAEDLPRVVCNAGKIQQALLVFLVNAIEAMPDGGVLTVTIASGPSGDGVVVRIQDTGCGIAPDHLQQIWEPFFTTKEDQHRTGLGLAIARGILDSHGVTVEVRSEMGQGTEFELRIPLEAPVTVNGGKK